MRPRCGSYLYAHIKCCLRHVELHQQLMLLSLHVSCRGQEYQDCTDEEFDQMTQFVQSKLDSSVGVRPVPANAEPALNKRTYLPADTMKNEL